LWVGSAGWLLAVGAGFFSLSSEQAVTDKANTPQATAITMNFGVNNNFFISVYASDQVKNGRLARIANLRFTQDNFRLYHFLNPHSTFLASWHH
jgi:hypothetical protein